MGKAKAPAELKIGQRVTFQVTNPAGLSDPRTGTVKALSFGRGRMVIKEDGGPEFKPFRTHVKAA